MRSVDDATEFRHADEPLRPWWNVIEIIVVFKIDRRELVLAGGRDL